MNSGTQLASQVASESPMRQMNTSDLKTGVDQLRERRDILRRMENERRNRGYMHVATAPKIIEITQEIEKNHTQIRRLLEANSILTTSRDHFVDECQDEFNRENPGFRNEIDDIENEINKTEQEGKNAFQDYLSTHMQEEMTKMKHKAMQQAQSIRSSISSSTATGLDLFNTSAITQLFPFIGTTNQNT